MEMNNRKINKKIPPDAYTPEGSMDLDNCYSQTVNELGLQQAKRDQILAFYLTILGFVIPNVIGMEVGNCAKGIAFFAMYIIGVMFCHVILRYRIYKEVYWIACRVITQLCNIRAEKRNKEIIYTLFFNALKNNMPTVVVREKYTLLKSFKKQLNSAETLLYETLVLFASFVGLIGAWYIWTVSKVFGAANGILVVVFLISMNYKYVKRIVALYDCVESEERSELEKTFSKAWMLHCFVDDIMQNEE